VVGFGCMTIYIKLYAHIMFKSIDLRFFTVSYIVIFVILLL